MTKRPKGHGQTQADRDQAFLARLTAAGAEVLAPTSAYEVMRFRTCFGTGVVYRNDRNADRKWNGEARDARAHLERPGSGSLAPVTRNDSKFPAGTVQRLLERDGDECFFCRDPMGGDLTVEHLVSRAHGGPNHIANLFAAHKRCNAYAGHLSAPEKIRLRENWTGPRPHAKESPCPTN